MNNVFYLSALCKFNKNALDEDEDEEGASRLKQLARGNRSNASETNKLLA